MAAENTALIKVVVADDQPVIRAGIAAILDAEPDLSVVGQSSDGPGVLRIIAARRPAVAVLDIRMPGMDGVAVAAMISSNYPETQAVMLTTFGLDEYVYAALRAGAAGFLLKDAEPEHLASAVRVVAGGGAMLDPGVTRRLLDRFATALAPAETVNLNRLTARETQVLTQVARGLSNAEIAAVLHISTATVKDHVAMVLSKLEVRDRVQATIAAYEGGLIRPGAV